jgi:hypothetical protein
LRHLIKICALPLLLCLPIAAQAAELYECQIEQNASNGGWIPAQVIVNYDAAQGEVIVFDPIIKHFQGAPVQGKVEIENKKRVTFNWRLKGTKDVIGQGAEFVYRLTVIKGNMVASMTAQALNYAGPFTASGKCVLSAG